jgi:hypothetical protein
MPCIVELHRGHEWDFVLRAASRFTGMDAAEVSIVGQHKAVELAARLALGIASMSLCSTRQVVR